MAEEPKRGPVQSGSMYIAIAQLRGQASSARWQHAVIFMLLNIPIIGWVKDVATSTQARYVFAALLASALAAMMNALWVGLVIRENHWIQFYTNKLRDMEIVGTESGVLVFAAPDFPSSAVKQVGVPFRSGISMLSAGITVLWLLACILLLVVAVFLWGAGKF